MKTRADVLQSRLLSSSLIFIMTFPHKTGWHLAFLNLLCIATFTATATQAAEGNAAAAQAKNSMCIGCHQIEDYKASFPNVYSVPLIKGQNAKYIEAALHAYKKGERSHPTMRAIAKQLSEQDIADLAAYYGAK